MGKFALLSAIMLILSGCTKDAPTSSPLFAPPPNLSGHWYGAATGLSLQVAFTVTETGAIEGSGYYGGIFFYVDGKVKYPEVHFTGTAPSFMPFQYQGRLISKDSIAGVINESGFTNSEASLIRLNR